MISAAVITPTVSRLAALLIWSPNALSVVISTWVRRRPRRAACISRRRSRGRLPTRSIIPETVRRPRRASAAGE